MTDLYQTIAQPTEGIYKEKGSKFLSFAFPVFEVEEAMAKVESFRKQYHDARHVCYAYTVGIETEQTRANDDGEPSGTAGRPILGQIRSFGLHNVLIIVVRYFGGVLLGTGGLTVAYKTAAGEALSVADIIEKTVDAEVAFHYDYVYMNDVMRIAKEEKVQMVQSTYEQVCRMVFRIRKSAMEQVRNRLLKIESLIIEDV